MEKYKEFRINIKNNRILCAKFLFYFEKNC